MRASFLALAVSSTAYLGSCAARPQLCAGAGQCREGLDCVAGMCEGSPSPFAGSRRLVLQPSDIAVLEQGPRSAVRTHPAVLTLGRANDGAELLLRFDLRLDRSANVMRASVLLDRSDAVLPSPMPVPLHGNRVIGRWDPRTVTWATAPPLQDVRSPRTLVSSSGPTRVRVDVTDLARRWLAHDVADQGVAIVAESASPTGVSFVLESTSLATPPDPHTPAEDREPPRLELYVH